MFCEGVGTAPEDLSDHRPRENDERLRTLFIGAWSNYRMPMTVAEGARDPLGAASGQFTAYLREVAFGAAEPLHYEFDTDRKLWV